MTDIQAMQLALIQAGLAGAAGEVPVGAVVLRAGVLIASGRNAPIRRQDPTAHAEIVALRAAAGVLGNYRLMDCELFVTLEPCAMCVGAMLHARLKRVVFGATDPKTGAAGSVLNLFAQARLNHQTQVQGGILAGASSTLLQDFFRKKREQREAASTPLRDDAVRTPDARFQSLPDYPWPARYVNDLPSLSGLRLHYLDEGPGEAARTYLCLHGDSAWSYAFRHAIPALLASGHRVIAPDLIGFGKSDKPKKESAHTLDWHRQVLIELIDRLAVKNVVLLVQGDSQALATALQRAAPERYVELLTVNPGELESLAADAPFPDQGHRAALRAFAGRAGTRRSSAI